MPALVICVRRGRADPAIALPDLRYRPVPGTRRRGRRHGVGAVLRRRARRSCCWYILAGPQRGAAAHDGRLRWPLFRDILRVGGWRCGAHVDADQPSRSAISTALVGNWFGRPTASPDTAPAARLEYLLVPLVFGLGAPLVAMVGTNIGAGQMKRALRVATDRRRGCLSLLAETLGVVRGDLAGRVAGPVSATDPNYAGHRQRVSPRGWGRSTGFSGWVWRSISPRRVRALCCGLLLAGGLAPAGRRRAAAG